MSIFAKWVAVMASRDAALASTRGADFEIAKTADDQASALTREMVSLEDTICGTAMHSPAGIRAKVQMALTISDDQADMDAICLQSRALLASALRDLDGLMAVRV